MSDNSTLAVPVINTDGDAPSTESDDYYNMGLHIAALFTNLAASSAGVLIPIILVRTRPSATNKIRIQKAITLGRNFGTGVVLATAFIHMLPSAFESMSDPSLPDFWTVNYTAWAGLFAMLAALMMHLIEFFATQRYYDALNKRMDQKLNGSIGGDGDGDGGGSGGAEDVSSMEEGGRSGHGRRMTEDDEESMAEKTSIPNDNNNNNLIHNHNHNHSHHHDHDHDHIHHDTTTTNNNNNNNIIIDSTSPTTTSPTGLAQTHDNGPVLSNHRIDLDLGADRCGHAPVPPVHSCHAHGDAFLTSDQNSNEEDESKTKLLMLTTYILELGIAMHSVIIGVTLGTLVGPEFVGLMIALIFHQFFEGIALGGRISSIDLPARSFKPWLLAFWFAISTPFGVVIGMAIRSSYNGDSVQVLLTQGIFDSLSAGILLYTSLGLIIGDWNSNMVFRQSSGENKLVQFTALWLGAASMALVGKWA